MYSATVVEALEDMTVLSGMLSVGIIPRRVLLDFGCTHSFISHAHTNRIGGKIEKT